MKPAPFDYIRAGSVEEAVSTLAERSGEAKLLAGGQSLMPMLNLRRLKPRTLIDIGALGPELRGIRVGERRIEIGALTTHTDAVASAELQKAAPLIPELVGQIGSLAIRNRGTLGGSVAFGDPVAEWAAAGLLLDARYTVRGAGRTREVAAADVNVDYLETSLAEDEMIVGASYERQAPGAGWASQELRRNAGGGLVAGAAALVSVEHGQVRDLRLSLLGLARRPLRAFVVEQELLETEADESLAERAGTAVAAWLEPRPEADSASGFRRRLAETLTRRTVALALTRADGAR